MRINIESQGAPVEVVLDGKVLGGSSGGGGGGSSGGSKPGPITSMPARIGDLGATGFFEKVVAPGEVVGLGITFRAGAAVRDLHWEGRPGDIFDYTSWAIFDSSGTKVMGQDDYAPSGTLGMGLSNEQLGVFGDGTYTLAVAIGSPAGNLAFHWNQP